VVTVAVLSMIALVVPVSLLVLVLGFFVLVMVKTSRLQRWLDPFRCPMRIHTNPAERPKGGEVGGRRARSWHGGRPGASRVRGRWARVRSS
ncbi:hypothetical protein HMPREF9440_01239, partial [Sutterella parvirubra YIT 11816]